MKTPVLLSAALLSAALSAPALYSQTTAGSSDSSPASAGAPAPATAPASTSAATAPTPAKAHGHGKSELEGLTAKLNLTADQQSKVADILKAKHDKSVPLRDQIEQVRKDAREQIAALLTPDQLAHFEPYKTAKRNEFKDLTAKLSLTADQQPKVVDILKAKDDKSEPLRKQIEQIHKDAREQIAALLTPDQLALFEPYRTAKKQ
jgi:Spy/CpxP family protein refolding chaperone